MTDSNCCYTYRLVVHSDRTDNGELEIGIKDVFSVYE